MADKTTVKTDEETKQKVVTKESAEPIAEVDGRPQWVKDVQADAERLTLKRLKEDKEETERLAALEAEA